MFGREISDDQPDRIRGAFEQMGSEPVEGTATASSLGGKIMKAHFPGTDRDVTAEIAEGGAERIFDLAKEYGGTHVVTKSMHGQRVRVIHVMERHHLEEVAAATPVVLNRSDEIQKFIRMLTGSRDHASALAEEVAFHNAHKSVMLLTLQ